MAQPPLFLNDLSYPFRFSDYRDIERCVSRWMSAIHKANSIADVVLVSAISPVDLRVTENHMMLPNVVARINRDWWIFLKRVDQRSPFHGLEHFAQPNAYTHIASHGHDADAFRWCRANSGFVISFDSDPRWSVQEIAIESCECKDGIHETPTAERLRNISSSDHADFWAEQLRSYARSLANSTLVYEGAEYLIRLFYNDHPPEHVHVFARGVQECIGRVRIDVVPPEMMDGAQLRGALRREVLRFVTDNREQLVAGWLRCREGLVPELIA